MLERIEVLSHPRAKEASESHASLRACGAARAATDLASYDQGAHTALGQIIVRRNAWNGDKDKEFG